MNFKNWKIYYLILNTSGITAWILGQGQIGGVLILLAHALFAGALINPGGAKKYFD